MLGCPQSGDVTRFPATTNVWQVRPLAVFGRFKCRRSVGLMLDRCSGRPACSMHNRSLVPTCGSKVKRLKWLDLRNWTALQLKIDEVQNRSSAPVQGARTGCRTMRVLSPARWPARASPARELAQPPGRSAGNGSRRKHEQARTSCGHHARPGAAKCARAPPGRRARVHPSRSYRHCRCAFPCSQTLGAPALWGGAASNRTATSSVGASLRPHVACLVAHSVQGGAQSACSGRHFRKCRRAATSCGWVLMPTG
jgi:hypothetical protein